MRYSQVTCNNPTDHDGSADHVGGPLLASGASALFLSRLDARRRGNEIYPQWVATHEDQHNGPDYEDALDAGRRQEFRSKQEQATANHSD
jgi:hypothetical protein